MRGLIFFILLIWLFIWLGREIDKDLEQKFKTRMNKPKEQEINLMIENLQNIIYFLEEVRDMEELCCRECGSLRIDSYGSGEDEHGEFEDYECLSCGAITRVYYEEAGKNV